MSVEIKPSTSSEAGSCRACLHGEYEYRVWVIEITARGVTQEFRLCDDALQRLQNQLDGAFAIMSTERGA